MSAPHAIFRRAMAVLEGTLPHPMKGMKKALKSSAQPRMYPVKSLKEWITALDAAMLVALTSAEVSAVHKLRTSTRRVEAQLVLLEILSAEGGPLTLSSHAREADEVRKRLRRVRQAAGSVRDLDVQTAAIRSDAPDKATVHKGSPGDALRKEAKKLRKHLESRRAAEEAGLIEVLKAEEEKLAAALRALEQALKPAARKGVSAAALVSRIEHWFTTESHRVLHEKDNGKSEQESLQLAIEAMDDEALHTVRKAAKLCRYMAESAPEGSPARAMSDRFEAIQEAGGTWHDWLLLEELSEDFHGRKAGLTLRYAKHSDAALADYRLRLAELLPKVSA